MPSFSNSVSLVTLMLVNLPLSPFLPKASKTMVMDLPVSEFSTISINRKLVGPVLLDTKLWALMKKANKSCLKDSTRTKINIGAKSSLWAAKLSQSLIFVAIKSISRLPSLASPVFLQITVLSSSVQTWVCKKWPKNTSGFVFSWKSLSLSFSLKLTWLPKTSTMKRFLNSKSYSNISFWTNSQSKSRNRPLKM